jgi:uncharacterized protein YbjT (DUF2867 family)
MAIKYAIALSLLLQSVDARTVLVTGATGTTGTFAYKWLQQQQGVEVRALVRNASIDKARSRLGCTKCDESEGIYIGDVTVPSTLPPAMANVDVLLMSTGSNSNPEAVIFNGTLNQIAAYAVAPGLELKEKHIVKVGAALTTKRINFIDILFAGGSFFYHGVSDTDISVSGIPFTILQPCRLADGPAHQNKIIVGHDDKPLPDGHAISGPSAGYVSRADVGHLAGYAAVHRNEAVGLKFDFCADLSKPPTGSEEEVLKAVFQEGMLPWDARVKKSSAAVLV